MSLPGVESARRRRASHGRSSTGISLQPPLRLAKLLPATFRRMGADDKDRDALQGRAMAARNRLDERLRVLVPSTTCTNTSSRRERAGSSSMVGHPPPVLLQEGSSEDRISSWRSSDLLRLREDRISSRRSSDLSRLSEDRISSWRSSDLLRLREGPRLPSAEVVGRSGRQEDCPICLDSFSSGQMVIRLPCQHRYHSDCLVPWLQHHCHCPFCRAKTV